MGCPAPSGGTSRWLLGPTFGSCGGCLCKSSQPRPCRALNAPVAGSLCPQSCGHREAGSRAAGLGTASPSLGRVWSAPPTAPSACWTCFAPHLPCRSHLVCSHSAPPELLSPSPPDDAWHPHWPTWASARSDPNCCLYCLIQAHKLLCDLGQISASVLESVKWGAGVLTR